MKPDKKIIFIVEDNEVYARSLQTFLQMSFPAVKEVKIFSIGELCLMDMPRNPSIVIMDYFLNSKFEEANNGIEIIKRIKDQRSKTHIIVLSQQENFDVILEAIKQYDCGYVKKDPDAFHNVELLIKEIFSRKDSPAFEPWN